MRLQGRIVLALVVLPVWIVVPGSASAHAYLVKTVPAAAGVLDVPPPAVQLTFDETPAARGEYVADADARTQGKVWTALSWHMDARRARG